MAWWLVFQNCGVPSFGPEREWGHAFSEDHQWLHFLKHLVGVGSLCCFICFTFLWCADVCHRQVVPNRDGALSLALVLWELTVANKEYMIFFFNLSLELDSIRYLKCELNITLYFCVVVIIFHLLCLWQLCSLWKAPNWSSSLTGPSTAGSPPSLTPRCCFPVPLFYLWLRSGSTSSLGWPQTVSLTALASQVLVLPSVDTHPFPNLIVSNTSWGVWSQF